MKHIYLSLAALLILSGCGESESSPATQASGVHFQGRDCLSCHNKDLAEDSYLSVGGTVYKSATSDVNDLNQACSERLHFQFFGGPNTKDYNAVDAPGFNGRGNVFALLKDVTINGTYAVGIVREDGTILASSGATHEFGGFDPSNPSDPSNRFSCNTCHQASPNNLNSAPGVLYAPGCN